MSVYIYSFLQEPFTSSSTIFDRLLEKRRSATTHAPPVLTVLTRAHRAHEPRYAGTVLYRRGPRTTMWTL